MSWIDTSQVGRFLLSHPWFPALVWAVLHTSDYYLTLLGARLRNAQTLYQYEGSADFAQHTDERRKLNRRYVIWLVVIPAVLLMPVVVPDPDIWGPMYSIYVGAAVVSQLVLHKQHLYGIALHRRMAAANSGMGGQFVLSTRASQWRSAVDLAGYAGLLAALSVLTLSPILLGGALAVASTASAHRKLSRQQPLTAAAQPSQDEAALISSTDEEVQSR